MTSYAVESKIELERRRFQFSLRTLLIVVTIVSVFLAWYVPKYQQAKRHESLLAWVERRGGKIAYELKEAPWWKLWGDQNEAQVTHLHLSSKVLSKVAVSDLTPLMGLTNLKVLDLNGTKVHDLTPLKGLTNLQWIGLNSTQVTDLAPLKGLQKLEFVYLNNSQVSDLTPLQDLRHLKQLHLGGTQVSDLSPLHGITSLEKLWLYDTQVSDLTPLKGLSNLKGLDLRGSQVSKEQLQMLKQALPNCDISGP